MTNLKFLHLLFIKKFQLFNFHLGLEFLTSSISSSSKTDENN